MTDTYTIFFYFHNQEEIQQIKSLDLILQKFVSYGYYLTTEADLWSIQAQFNQWLSQLHSKTEQDQIPPIPFQPGISDQGREQVSSFCQAQVGQCELGGFWAANSGPGRGFDFRLTLYNTDPIPGTLGISFDQDFFISIDHVDHYKSWLEILEAVYNTNHFLYAYQLDHSRFHQPTLRADLLTYGVTHLYPLNIFGPELVKQLGRERLLSAPAGLITTLNDSSFFLIPYISGSTLPDKRLASEPREVANYLGLIYGEL